MRKVSRLVCASDYEQQFMSFLTNDDLQGFKNLFNTFKSDPDVTRNDIIDMFNSEEPLGSALDNHAADQGNDSPWYEFVEELGNDYYSF